MRILNKSVTVLPAGGREVRYLFPVSLRQPESRGRDCCQGAQSFFVIGKSLFPIARSRIIVRSGGRIDGDRSGKLLCDKTE